MWKVTISISNYLHFSLIDRKTYYILLQIITASTKHASCLLKYLVICGVLTCVTEWMKIKPTFICSVILQTERDEDGSKNSSKPPGSIDYFSMKKTNVTRNVVGCLERRVFFSRVLHYIPSGFGTETNSYNRKKVMKIIYSWSVETIS